jgi:hypothetical protein
VTALASTVPVKGPRQEGGIVTSNTFLGSVTRVGVLLSGDVTVQVDKPSSEAAALAPGTSVSGYPADGTGSHSTEALAALRRHAGA